MGSKKDLTEVQRSSIVYGHLRGDSLRTIAAIVGCSKSAVWNIVRKFRDSGASEAQKKKTLRPGRSSLLTPSDRSNLKKLVTNGNRHLNLTQITNLFNVRNKKKISTSTVRRALHKANLNSCVAVPKPLISPENAKKRLDWSLEHRNWSLENFKRVIWSDETTIRLFQGSPGRVWREPNERWKTDCVGSTVKQSPGRMYWGCFSWFGVGPLVPLESTATGASHVEILRKYFISTQKNFPGRKRRGRPILQQDNAKPHSAKIAKEFIAKNRIRLMNWPPQSPDLNPIENLWAELKKSVRRKEKKPSNLKELDALVKEAWNEIPPEYCRRLVVSMRNRVNACIEVGGGPTKY
jgi:transposase